MAFKRLKPDEWMTEIAYGLEYRRRFGLEDRWGELEAIYYNVHPSRINTGPNIFLATGDSMLSSITVPAPRIALRATDFESVDKAPILESLDNTLIEVLGISDEMETLTLHAFLFGTGFLKIGYDSEFGFDKSQDLGGSLQLGLTLTQLDKHGKRRIEHNSRIAAGMPWVKAVSPHDIILPWGTSSIYTAPWVAHRIVRHIDDVKADLKYSFTRDLKGQMSMEDFIHSYQTPMARRFKTRTAATIRAQEPEFVELYEIHDRRTGMIYVITPDHDRFLREDENSLQIDNRLPFVSLSFTPTTRSIWTTPDVFYLYEMQNELSDIAVQRTKQRRLAVLKFLYDEGSIDEEELEKVLSTDVGVAAKIKSGRSLNEAITRVENNSTNTGLIQEEEHLRANIREQIGFSRNQMGEYTGGRKTAREVGAVERSSVLRMSRRGLRMKRVYEDLFKIINGMVFEFWTLDRYVEVLGSERGQEFVQTNGPALRGNYKYQIEFLDETDLQQRGQVALQLYGFLAQDPSIDPVALRQYLVNKINDPSFSRIFNADIQAAMQQVRNGGGGAPQDVRSPSQVLQLQDSIGQGSSGLSLGLLAGRGNNA